METKPDIIHESVKTLGLSQICLLESLAAKFPDFDKVGFVRMQQEMWKSFESSDPRGERFILESRRVWDRLLEIYERSP